MKHTDCKKKAFTEKTAAVLIALLIWQALSSFVGSRALLASPSDVLKTLVGLIPTLSFWRSVCFSLLRIVSGYILAFITGSALGIISGTFHIFEVMLWPYIALIKATPVASFIILCLIWLDSKSLSVCISFLMVMPLVYSNILASLHARDGKMEEMAKVFSMPRMTKLLYVDLPQMKPYILSAASSGMGLAWKAGISAEVIGIPGGSIGERLYQAKIYLSSAELFAWTAALVLCSIALEKLFCIIIKRAFALLEDGK